MSYVYEIGGLMWALKIWVAFCATFLVACAATPQVDVAAFGQSDQKYQLIPEEQCPYSLKDFMEWNEGLFEHSAFKMEAKCTLMGRALGVKMPDESYAITFKIFKRNVNGRTDLTAAGEKLLDELAMHLRLTAFGKDYYLKVFSATDDTGQGVVDKQTGLNLNQALSQERAALIIKHLKSKGLTMEMQAVAVGDGPLCPKAHEMPLKFGPHFMQEGDDCRFSMLFAARKGDKGALIDERLLREFKVKQRQTMKVGF